MDNGITEIAKFFGGLISTAVSTIIYLGKRQDRANRVVSDRLRAIDEKVVAMDKQSAEDRAAIRENVQRLREKIEQERIDFKENLKVITEYMYNRPR